MASGKHRIGRYEIIGRLAIGGMGEVLLARLQGPHGFERPLVIKRILPHLALEQRVVDMFLDEARIIARLRHPNLIRIEELGRDGDDLFIAMEYLEGESVSGVCRRLASRDDYVDFTLAAHIVAEACAGLHAAHEARTEDGRPLEIVHRDVSPQNIIVGYSGSVHVIDFGIATSVDRIGRTEAGLVRGKMEYLAPEQLESAPCDRRTDVFALGIVLFELATGRRLFKRGSHAETVLAVLTDAVPTMASFREDAPRELQDICARALAKDRRQRFDTAADMRRELLAFVRRHAHDDPSEALALRMQRLFSDRISEKAEMLRRARKGDELHQLPLADVDISVDLPTVAGQTVLSQVSEVRPLEGRTGQRWWAAGSVALAMAAAAGAAFHGRWHASAHGEPSVVQTEPVLTPSSASTTPGSTLPLPTVQNALSAPTPVTHVRVESSPVPATVLVDGITRGTTPLALSLDAGQSVLRIDLRARGFQPAARSIMAGEDQVLKVDLVPSRSLSHSGAAHPAPTSSPTVAPIARTPPTLW